MFLRYIRTQPLCRCLIETYGHFPHKRWEFLNGDHTEAAVLDSAASYSVKYPPKLARWDALIFYASVETLLWELQDVFVDQRPESSKQFYWLHNNSISNIPTNTIFSRCYLAPCICTNITQWREWGLKGFFWNSSASGDFIRTEIFLGLWYCPLRDADGEESW